jgi:hypothetical protein
MTGAKRDFKGKGRAFIPRDWGSGGVNGSLIDLTLLGTSGPLCILVAALPRLTYMPLGSLGTGDGVSVAVYALPVNLGPSASDVYAVQVDIGSSDTVSPYATSNLLSSNFDL